MNTVKTLVNLIFIPFGVLLFFSVGIFCALLSGLIEFCVFREFFTSSYQTLIPSFALAFVLVFSLEFSKFFLHFYQSRCKELQKGRNHLISAVRIGLIVLSFVCTAIFTVTTLDKGAYNEISIQDSIDSIEAKLDDDIAQVKSETDVRYEKNMKPFLNAKQSAEENFSAPPPPHLGPQRLEKYMERLQTAVDNATDDYKKAVDRYEGIRDKNYTDKVNELRTIANQKILALTDDSAPELAARFDNPILSHFLSVLAQTLWHISSYSRPVYLWTCLLLGILVSLFLEALISISASLMATSTDFLSEHVEGVGDMVQKWCNQFVVLMFKTFCAVMVYIIIVSMFQSAELEKTKFLMGIAACGVSIYLVSHFMPSPDVPDFDASPNAYLFYQIRDCTVQGIVSLMGYVLLGLLCGQEAINLDLNTVAIGFGSAISGGLGILPKVLLARLPEGQSD
ncbi:hypothetical protein [Clostridium fessum]|uniref:hypothetical protein n=1 Tax=Clostridium fessum TaxID=2126740 RepID=UPI0022E0D05C|nr:hypothetical protein [Clostridium fessum]